MSGAPVSNEETHSCSNALIELNEDASWIYTQTAELTAPTTWTQSIENLATNSDGNTVFTVIMEESSGIENRVTHTTKLDLVCIDNNLFITGVLETKNDVEWTTVYDEGSVYMPSRLSEGVMWERHGSMRTVADEVWYESRITERQMCTAMEGISITAGEFDAWRVEYSLEIESDGDTMSVTGAAWYVPGLGRILNIGEIEGNPTMELISYENVAPRT